MKTYKLAADTVNGWTVDVIAHIFESLNEKSNDHLKSGQKAVTPNN